MKHPYTGQRKLVWNRNADVRVAEVSQPARYNRGAGYDVLSPFATVRPSFTGSGLLSPEGVPGLVWVVTRGNFDEITEHKSLAAAILHVESLFALESP